MSTGLVPTDIGALLAGSDFDGPPRQWRRCRDIFNKFIADGESVLDVGCANGLLLASLIVWRDRPFIPYGFDFSAERIAQAKLLFGPFGDHFWIADFRDKEWAAQMVDVVIAPLPVDLPVAVSVDFMHRCVALAQRCTLFHLYEDEMRFASQAEDLVGIVGFPFQIESTQSGETLVVACLSTSPRPNP